MYVGMSLTRDLSLLKDSNISCMYVCVHVCMYVRVHACEDESDKRSCVVERYLTQAKWAEGRSGTRSEIDAFIICMYVCMHVYVCMCMHVCVYVCVYVL